MTKKLTEQIVHIKNNWIDEKNTVPFFDYGIKASFKEGEIVGKSNKDRQIECLEKKLEIATKALKEYADSSNWYETDDFGISAVDQFACDDYGYNIAQEALKEMEGVK